MFKTASGETNLAKISNDITHALIKNSSIVTLDLQGVYLNEITSPYPNVENSNSSWEENNNATFYIQNNNTTLKKLYTPQTKDGSTLKCETFKYLQNLEELHISEGIDTLGHLSVQIENQGFGQKLKVLTFPNSLTTVKSEACKGLQYVETFTFPSGMKEIEKDAFTGTKPKDVYFLGTDAPKVACYAWGDDAYIANNALTDSVADGESGKTVIVDMRKGVACRANYVAQSGWQAMLHYPAACTKAQAARYTDLTRNYRRINKGDTGTDITQNNNNNNNTYTIYTPGKESTELKGKTNSTQNTAVKSFQSGDETSAGFTYNSKHSYTGGFYDMYVGEQYLWPSMDMAYRATVMAQNNKLWNGTSSIADGIQTAEKEDNNPETTSYSGDGSEYIGLHQFVFAKADVTAKKTDEWDMSKYSDGKWHSICLPLNITKAEMKEIFGHDKDGKYNIRLCKFSKVTRISEGEKKHLTLFFDDEKFENAADGDIVLEAHVSYMIKAKKENAVEGENIVLKNYQIVAGNPVPTNVTVNESDTETASDDEGVSTQSTYQYYFIGNYLPNICMPQYCYFFSKQKSLFRFQQGTKAKWNAYTSIVEAPEGTKDNELYFSGSSSNGGEDNAKLYTAFDPEDEDNNTTAINRVTIIADGEIVSTNDNVYNLNGQLVSTNGRTGLPKGIYVQGGKKYIVK